jgi:lysophospholipase L1-like esterase
VRSHALRLTAMRASFATRTFNDAKSGAKMNDLARQAGLAVSRGVDYVTVLLGANDACTGSVASMTSVAAYRSQLDAGLAVLRDGLPSARILVVSVPDVQQLHVLFRDDATARDRWDLFNICQSMLVRPGSDDPADVSRRAAVTQRVRDFNTQLEQACAALNDLALPDRCRLDAGAVFGTRFTPELVSSFDYFHPSLAGQAALSAGTWDAGYEFVDTAAPETTASATPDGEVTFGADEVARFECRLDGGGWQACAGPVRYPGLAAGAHAVEVRAVDTAGNGDPTPAVARWEVAAAAPSAVAASAPSAGGAPAAPVAIATRPRLRPPAVSGGRRSGRALTELRIGPGARLLRSLTVRFGAGVTLRLPAGGRLGTVTFVDAAGTTLRRVGLRGERRAGRIRLRAARLSGTFTVGRTGALTLTSLPAGTAGVRIALSARAVVVKGACRAPGWRADVRDTGGARSTLRADRAC